MKFGNYRYIHIFIFFFFISKNFAQNINGTVTSEGKPIENVSVLIKDKTYPKVIVQYTVSDSLGRFSLNLDELKENLILELVTLNFKKKVLFLIDFNIANLNSLVIELEPKINDLDEVIIIGKKNPIKIKKDTIVYNPTKFSDGTEKVVEDLLKKLPGIDVDNTGVIKFNGKPITSLLLEGDDLFGYNYSIGSKNIDINVVEEIEAIENYNENPLLNDIKISDDVAINLKLKKGISDFSGNSEIGLGNDDFFKTKNTLLSLSNLFKGFSSVQYNNISENHTPYDILTDKLSIEDRNQRELLSQKIINDLNSAKIFNNENFTSKNNTFYYSLNSLFKINKRNLIKFNLGYFKDKLENESSNETTYLLNDGFINTVYNNNYVKKPRIINYSFEFKSDISPTFNLLYKAKIKLGKDRTYNTGQSNNNLKEFFLTKDEFTRHDLRLTKKINSKNVIQVKGLFSYSNSTQQYDLFPGFDLDEGVISENLSNSQHVELGKRYVELCVNWRHSMNKKTTFELNTGLTSIKNSLNTVLKEFEGDDLYNTAFNFNSKNNFDYNINKYFLNIKLQYKINKFKITPDIKFNYVKTLFDDVNFNENNYKKGKISSNSSLKISYSPAEFSSIIASYRLDQNEPREENLHDGYILTSSNRIQNNSLSFEMSNRHNFIFGFFKNDFYNLFRFNFFINHSFSVNNMFSNPTITEDLIFVSRFFSKKGDKNTNFNFFVSKYIGKLKTTSLFTSLYSINKYKNIVNESNIRENKNETWSNQIYLKTNLSKKVNLENKLSFTRSRFYSDSQISNKTNGLENSFTFIYKPSEKFTVQLNKDFIHLNNNKDFIFINSLVSYNKNENVSYSLIGTNLTNNKELSSTIGDDYSNSRYVQEINNLSLLLAVNFRF